MEIIPPKFNPAALQPFQAKPICPFCGRVEQNEKLDNIERDIPITTAIDRETNELKTTLRCKRCGGSWESQTYADSEAFRELRKKLCTVERYANLDLLIGCGLCVSVVLSLMMITIALFDRMR